MHFLVKSFAYAAVLGLASVAHAADESHGEAASFTEADIPTLGSVEAGAELVATCAACHGQAGASTIAENPKLAGQSATYLYEQLVAFKSGERENAIMAGQVAELSEQDMKDISSYFADQPISYAAKAESETDGGIDRGEHIYLNGIADQNVPSCIGCHGVSGLGIESSGYPVLAGQHAEYLETRLNDMAANPGYSDGSTVMHQIAQRLLPADRAAIASYIQGLKP